MSVHLRNSEVRAGEIIVADEAVALTGAILRISGYLGTDNHSEIAECFIKQFFVNFWIKISYENICANVLGSLVLRGFVDF